MKTFIQYLDTQLTEEILDACQLDELIAATPRRVRAVAKIRAREAGRSRGWKLKGDKEPYSQYKGDSSTPSERNIPDASAQRDYKTERGYTRAANDPKLSPKFKEKLNRIATKARTSVIKTRPWIHGGESFRAGELPQQDYKPAEAEIKAGTHKTPQKPN